MANGDKPKGHTLSKPENPRCSVCGGTRRAIYPSGQPSKLNAYLWCPTCDGSSVDLPKKFLDREDS